MNERQETTSNGLESGNASRSSNTWDIVKVLLVSLAIVLPIRAYVAQPFVVRGASMEPTFDDRDYLVIDQISYRASEPRRGEVIVFRYPRDTSQFFIKRIIGLPRETIAIVQGGVRVINVEYPEGFLLDESYLESDRAQTHPEGVIVLGEDEYFVLGDNRLASSDSRVWGPLPRRLIMGRTLLRAWPVARAGVVLER